MRIGPAGTRGAPPGLLIAVLAFAGLGAAFTQTIPIPIQGQLPELLGASPEDTAWTVTITLLVAAVSTPIAGKLGDMFGKKLIAAVLLGLLCIGSIAAALAADLLWLVVGRGLQGTGMGVVPLGISILRDVIPAHRLGTGIALVSATLGIGAGLGLPASAFVAERADWHILFWISAAMSAVALTLVVVIIPGSSSRTGGRFDLPGAVGLGIGLTCLLLVVSKGARWGWSSPGALMCLSAGVIVLIAWGTYELRTTNPIVDIRVSSRGAVLLTNAASIALGFAFFALNIIFPQWLTLPKEAGGMGLTLLAAGLVLMPSGLAMLAVSPIAGMIERRVGPKPLLLTGAAVIAVGYVAALVADLTIWRVLAVNTLVGVGIGLGYAAMPTLIMLVVPMRETGAANGLNTLMRALGTSIAAAVVAAILAASSVDVGDVTVPSAAGFRSAIFAGLAAAVGCVAIAGFIPNPRRRLVAGRG